MWNWFWWLGLCRFFFFDFNWFRFFFFDFHWFWVFFFDFCWFFTWYWFWCIRNYICFDWIYLNIYWFIFFFLGLKYCLSCSINLKRVLWICKIFSCFERSFSNVELNQCNFTTPSSKIWIIANNYEEFWCQIVSYIWEFQTVIIFSPFNISLCLILCFRISLIDEEPFEMSIVVWNWFRNTYLSSSIHVCVCICC